jgi:hypothetical protein
MAADPPRSDLRLCSAFYELKNALSKILASIFASFGSRLEELHFDDFGDLCAAGQCCAFSIPQESK